MKDTATHVTKKVRLPRDLIARVKRTLADLEVERGHYLSFNEGAAEALEQFATAHETRRVTP